MRIDRSSGVPLQRQLETELRDAILSGRMKAGERVMSSRELQTHLGLSRNTIVNALAQLHAEGYLETVHGVGTFVAQTLHGQPGARRSPRVDREVVPTRAAARALDAHELAANLHGAVPFRPGIPALDLFPSAAFRRCLHASDWTPDLLDYPPPGGDPVLREAIAHRLQLTRGVTCAPDDVLVVGGAQAAFALIAQVLLSRGEHAAVEEPGYPSVRAIFAAFGARIARVPVDADGIDVTRIARTKATLVHVTPSHQYPTGAVLTLERRFALLAWARAHDAWIVEDDYDSEFTYTGKPHPALHGLDEGRRVIYVGTFSKTLSPALRVAYLVVPRALRAAFIAMHDVLGAQPSAMLQRALGTFMHGGHFARHVTAMRKCYDERRRTTSAEFARTFGSAMDIRDTRAGLHFIALFPKGVDDAAFSAGATARGLIVPPLSRYYGGKATLNGVVIGFAATSPERTSGAIRDLYSLL